MKLPHSEPPERFSRFSIAFGWLLSALSVFGAAALLSAMTSRPQPLLMWPLSGFMLFACVALAGIGVSPTARYLRDRALLARWSERLTTCPSCGATRGDGRRCAVCDHPLTDDRAYWVVASPHWGETAAAACFGPSSACLAAFFAVIAGHVHKTSTAVVLWLFVLFFVVVAAVVVWFAIAALRGILAAPLALTFTRSWERGGAWWYTTSKGSLRGDEWTAEGQSEGPASDLSRVSDDGDVTAFERGLAALLASWNRDDRAPLCAMCKLTWRLVPTVERSPTSRPEAVYREAAQTPSRDGVERETRVTWTVSFNQYPLGELLDEAKLPAPTDPPEDDERDELFDADWSVDLAQVMKVFARDAALCAAIEGLTEQSDDDHARIALDAVRASRS